MNEIVLIALRRPYTFVVMSILIVLLGSITVLHMPTDVFRNITIPVASEVWVYAGLLPQQVDGRITDLYERFLTSWVKGINYMASESYHVSSIIDANIMNECGHLEPQLQFDYLLNSVRKEKRFSKWFKPESDADLDMLCTYFTCNKRRAMEYKSILTSNQLDQIRKSMSTGGARK